jgi:hypothetical protein
MVWSFALKPRAVRKIAKKPEIVIQPKDGGRSIVLDNGLVNHIFGFIRSEPEELIVRAYAKAAPLRRVPEVQKPKSEISGKPVDRATTIDFNAMD